MPVKQITLASCVLGYLFHQSTLAQCQIILLDFHYRKRLQLINAIQLKWNVATSDLIGVFIVFGHLKFSQTINFIFFNNIAAHDKFLEALIGYFPIFSVFDFVDSKRSEFDVYFANSMNKLNNLRAGVLLAFT